MDDPKRALRYLLPGATCLFELALLILLTDPKWLCFLMSKDAGGITAATVVVAVATVVGWLLSQVHHGMIWYSRIGPRYGVDYRPIVTTLLQSGRAQICYLGSPRGGPLTVSYPGAWRIVQTLWDCDCLKQQRAGAEALTDTVHGLGTAFVGAVAAIVAWGLIALAHFLNGWDLILPGATAVLFLMIHWCGYRNTAGHSLALEVMTLCRYLPTPVRAWVGEEDVERG